METAALLAALHARGEEPQEVAGAASAFRQVARDFPSVSFPLVDVVGTGGDGVGTINISTGAGLVAASMGVAVAKHGNRAVSSKTGAADVIAELGLPLDVEPATAVELLARDHFTFLFAQAYDLQCPGAAGEPGTPDLPAHGRVGPGHAGHDR